MNNIQREYTIKQIRTMDNEIKKLRFYAVAETFIIGGIGVLFASSIIQSNFDDFKEYSIATKFLVGASAFYLYHVISNLTKIAGINSFKLNLEHMLEMDKLNRNQYEKVRHL